jgi:hypothetical protein
MLVKDSCLDNYISAAVACERPGAASARSGAARPAIPPRQAATYPDGDAVIAAQDDDAPVGAHVARGHERDADRRAGAQGGLRPRRQPGGGPIGARGAQHLGHDHQVAAQRVDEQRLGVVGAVGIAQLQAIRRSAGAGADNRLGHAVDVDRRALRGVVPDVADVEQRPAVGVRPHRDVLPVHGLGAGDRGARGDPAVGPQAIEDRPGAGVVVAPQQIGLRAAAHQAAELVGRGVGDASGDPHAQSAAQGRRARRGGPGGPRRRSGRRRRGYSPAAAATGERRGEEHQRRGGAHQPPRPLRTAAASAMSSTQRSSASAVESMIRW